MHFLLGFERPRYNWYMILQFKEDDMTIALEDKMQYISEFCDNLHKKGWTFDKSTWSFTKGGPDEKDRNLLIEFNVVIEEFLKLDEKYQKVIYDCTKEMAAGMKKYLRQKVTTITDYNDYCYYVAGIVGVGLSGLFAASGLEGTRSFTLRFFN